MSFSYLRVHLSLPSPTEETGAGERITASDLERKSSHTAAVNLDRMGPWSDDRSHGLNFHLICVTGRLHIYIKMTWVLKDSGILKRKTAHRTRKMGAEF